MNKRVSNAPYYIGMSVYLGINAFLYFCLNQTVQGSLSDVYLGASTLCGVLCFVSVTYLFMENDGDDSTEADVTVAGITFHKGAWYLGSIAAIAARLYFAYQANHNATGMESIWGYVWFVGSLALLAMTWPNAKAYFSKRIRLAQAEKAAEAAAAKAAAAPPVASVTSSQS